MPVGDRERCLIITTATSLSLLRVTQRSQALSRHLARYDVKMNRSSDTSMMTPELQVCCTPTKPLFRALSIAPRIIFSPCVFDMMHAAAQVPRDPWNARRSRLVLATFYRFQHRALRPFAWWKQLHADCSDTLGLYARMIVAMCAHVCVLMLGQRKPVHLSACACAHGRTDCSRCLAWR